MRKSGPLSTIESVFRTNTHRRQADSAHPQKTKVRSVAKLRLGDLEKKGRQLAEHQVAVADGSMTVADTLATYRQRLEGDASIKPRTREYHQQRITALLKSWPELKQTEVRGVTKTDCLNWAARFGKNSSATAFNHTIGILRRILEVGVETGVRYDNPARFIKRRSEKAKPIRGALGPCQ
jgi:hypothetical protein